MTERERILSLTAGPEMDREVAEKVMLWRNGKPGVNASMWVDASGKEVASTLSWLHDFWNPSFDCNDVRAMEDEIERRGLAHQYLAELAMLLGMYTEDVPDEESPDPFIGDLRYSSVWALLRASAADRCRAALLVVGE